MRRNHQDEFDFYSHGVASEFPQTSNVFDEDESEVPMFEPDDDDDEEDGEATFNQISPIGDDSDEDSAHMSDTAEGCLNSSHHDHRSTHSSIPKAS